MHCPILAIPVLAMLGHWEIMLIVGLGVLLFFGKRIPEVMRSLGRGITQFKKGLHDTDDEKPASVEPAKKGALPSPKESDVERPKQKAEHQTEPMDKPG